MPNKKSYLVHLVDDHHMMRLGLIALAQTSGLLNISWIESSNLDDAMHTQERQNCVDLVLLDLNLPDSQGLQGLRCFLQRFPRARVAVFSATEDEFVVRQALALGAVGFVGKSAAANATLVLVESLLVGANANLDTEPMPLDSLIDPPSTSTKINESQAVQAPSQAAVQAATRARLRGGTAAVSLSATQILVLELVLEGMSNQEIANASKLALGTVKNTVSAVMLLLDVHSLSHLISVFR